MLVGMLCLRETEANQIDCVLTRKADRWEREKVVELDLNKIKTERTKYFRFVSVLPRNATIQIP